jgi:hypothetical protein
MANRVRTKKGSNLNAPLNLIERVTTRINAAEIVSRRPRFNGSAGFIGTSGTAIGIQEFIGECDKLYDWMIEVVK